MNAEKLTDSQNEQLSEAEKILGSMPSFEELNQENPGQPHRKTFQEKAEERNYYKNEDGEWTERFDDGFDESATWFKLDEEYPDLADKTEALAEELHVKYGDYGGLKRAVYEHAGTLSDADDAHLKDIFLIASSLAFSTGGTEDKLVSYSADELCAIRSFLENYYAETKRQMPNGELDRDIKRMAECFVRKYTPKLVEGDFLEKFSEYSAKAFSGEDRTHCQSLMTGIERGINGLSANEESGKYFGGYMDYVDKLASERPDDFEVLFHYVEHHGIDEKTVKGFKDIIFPLVRQGEPEVEAIATMGNTYGIIEGYYGIADYTEECLLSEYNPKDINKLLCIYHEMPTSDFRKFEQNRKDASRLQGTIIGGRDFIHDERAGVNEVLSAIKDYYDHRESEDVESYKQKLESLENKYRFGVLPNAFKLEEYEKPVEYMANQNAAEKGDPNERAIDILNRLVENTRPSLLEAPETKYPELNELMSQISPLVNEQTGEVRIDVSEVGAAIAKMNEILLEKRNEQGIMPSTISAIAFLDKMSAYALRNASAKEIRELAFDPNFKEILRFSQLTSSTEYDERSFENKCQQIVDKVSEAYGDDGVDTSIIADGYKLLSQNILGNMQALGKTYTSKKTTARFRDAIWSGNLSDELIGLFQKI
ncbi:hypothetical protein IK110_01260 [Candidatus Saccharibacteria bacterium]|nr:hypothetical protein [Candidatus Saccharibacteria bacterium]